MRHSDVGEGVEPESQELRSAVSLHERKYIHSRKSSPEIFQVFLLFQVLKKNERECKEVKPEDVTKYYANPDKLVELVRLTMIDASYIIMIMFELNVMPLALQITCIAGAQTFKVVKGNVF